MLMLLIFKWYLFISYSVSYICWEN